MKRHAAALACVLLGLASAPAFADMPSDRELMPIDLEAKEAPFDRDLLPWFSWDKPTTLEWTMLLVAESLIVVDVLQTLDLKNHQGEGISEHNLLLGSHPSDLRIALSGAAGGLAVAGLWYLAPPRVRWLIPSVLMVAEGFVIYSNARVGMRIRF